jgi:hypothetical protein
VTAISLVVIATNRGMTPIFPSTPYRSEIRKQLLEIVDTMPLALMAAAREKKVRAFVKETVGDLLINQRSN